MKKTKPESLKSSMIRLRICIAAFILTILSLFIF